MIEPLPSIAHLLGQVAPFVTRGASGCGSATPVPRMTVWSATQPTPPIPAMFKPMFFVVLQGTKTLTIAGNRFELQAGDCAASSFGMPYVGQVDKATPRAPYVALGLDLDVDLLTDVMLDMPKREDRWVCSAARSKLDGPVGQAFTRLVGLISAPDDQAVLGRHYEFELYYRLLQSSMGDTLRQIGQRDNRQRQIKTAADWLSTNPEKPINVTELAAFVGMSLTSFHRHFRAVTGYSPLAFQRQIRLLEARRLLVAGGVSVSRVAFDVGYVSPSQFSREYKSMFGVQPTADLAVSKFSSAQSKQVSSSARADPLVYASGSGPDEHSDTQP